MNNKESGFCIATVYWVDIEFNCCGPRAFWKDTNVQTLGCNKEGLCRGV